MANLSGNKRKRVRIACENCRALKSKCDENYPICGRCQGYGYQCVWPGTQHAAGNDHGHQVDRQSQKSSFSTTVSLRNAIEAYENLARSFNASSGTEIAALNVRLSCIRNNLPADVLHQLPALSGSGSGITEIKCEDQPADSQRYLGRASDIQFFKSIRDVFRESSTSVMSNGEEINTYEQDYLEQDKAKSIDSQELPTGHLAKMYIDVYFSTIHLAYPFLCKPQFLQEYERFVEVGGTEEMDTTWMSILYTIFAIGAFYNSFSSQENSGSYPHINYFRTAETFAHRRTDSRSLKNVCAILVQCFYLLAVSQTDRCWTHLGLAIRIGQSIGLHVDSPGARAAATSSIIKQELRRRTWYSLYVLDRLLALQLGRPAAIHEHEYSVILPSAYDDSLFDMAHDKIPVSSEVAARTNEYSLSVIKLSTIIGHVIRDLYNVVEIDSSIERTLTKATLLDKELLNWKSNLPRNLRFDLGHTFENSITFQRQRNMLAIKFHHLRAMICRPFLWSNRFHGPDAIMTPLSDENQKLVARFRKSCVLEARETAQLLYRVQDERSLVQDFPWWQMISCLICASSILLVASTSMEMDETCEDITSLTLEEDAETCLKVFHALSANSAAARLAREMMRDLKEARFRVRSGDDASRLAITYQTASTSTVAQSQKQQSGAIRTPNIETPLSDFSFSDSSSCHFWPSEISESMLWSAEFVDTFGALDPNA